MDELFDFPWFGSEGDEDERAGQTLEYELAKVHYESLCRHVFRVYIQSIFRERRLSLPETAEDRQALVYMIRGMLEENEDLRMYLIIVRDAAGRAELQMLEDVFRIGGLEHALN